MATAPPSVIRAAFCGRAWWVCLLLGVVTLAVYAPVWRHEFLLWDDPLYLTDNPTVSAGFTWRGLAWAFTKGSEPNWLPLTWLSHMLDVELHGLQPGPHHLTSVIFHIVNTLLLFGLLRAMTGAVGPSAFVAGMFALHPLHVESVAWAAERKDVLSTLFWMLTLWAYLAYVRRPGWWRSLGVFVVFGLGLMAKPMLVTLPLVLLLLDYWPLRRVSSGTPGPGLSAFRWSAWLPLLREKLPWLALSAASSVGTFMIHRHGAVMGLDERPLGLRLATALTSYAAYLGKTLWPAGLAALYPLPRVIAPGAVSVAIVLLAGVSAAVVWLARTRPYLLVGWLWYLGTLVPVIGLVQAGHQGMADRYTYVPLIGLFIAVGWGLTDLLGDGTRARAALATSALLALAACAVVTRHQVRYWQDDVALWEHTLAVTDANPLAHDNLAVALRNRGRTAEAIAHSREAVGLRPDYARAHNNLATALASQGQASEAIAHFTAAIRLEPGFAEAHSNLGLALASQGRMDDAIAEYTEAVRLKPNFVIARNNLALALAGRGRAEQAVQAFRESLRAEPAQPGVHYAVAALLQQQGRTDEAVRHLEAALRLSPNFHEAWKALNELRGGAASTGRQVR